MLFFIAAIFLFNSTKAEKTEARELTGISGERFAEIPTNEIQRATPRTEAGATVYDVTLAPGSTNTTTSEISPSKSSRQLPHLVTAVAAFYFGANSVSAAHKEAPSQTVQAGR